MGLTTLPKELLSLIGRHLDHAQSLVNLAKTSRQMYHVFIPEAYRSAKSTPIVTWATVRGLRRTIRLCFENNYKNAAGRDGANALIYASLSGREGLVRLLITKGLEVNCIGTFNGFCGGALQVASMCGHLQIVEFLIARGACVNRLPGINGHNSNVTDPLHVAVERGFKSIVEALLDAGANIEGCGPEYTPLEIATLRGNEDMVRLLLVRGADINSTRSTHGRPIWIAAAHRHRRIIELLLAHYADLNAKIEVDSALSSFVGEHENTAREALAQHHHDFLTVQHEALHRAIDIDLRWQGGNSRMLLVGAAQDLCRRFGEDLFR